MVLNFPGEAILRCLSGEVHGRASPVPRGMGSQWRLELEQHIHKARVSDQWYANRVSFNNKTFREEN